MRATELKKQIEQGVLNKYAHVYSNVSEAGERFSRAIDSFVDLFGDREARLLSVPGRTEICGNHTDHNNGMVLAGAIDRDIIAVAAASSDGVIRFFSEGYPMATVSVDSCADADKFENYSSASLIAGMVDGFTKNGYKVGGLDVYCTSQVLKGSGISSSAAYEVMIGNALNYLYNDGKVENREIARLAQYAENAFFGKPSGLMDQMACAVGGFVYIDFAKESAVVEPIDFSLSEAGYALCIVNTGGNHADLNDDYASVPCEMKAVAKQLGREVLNGITEAEIVKSIHSLRQSLGDRAVLRAIHFVRENGRVLRARESLKEGDVDGFLSAVDSSGASSFKYLQNVYTTLNVREQGLSLALALADGYLAGRQGACRVHGGGFAGTVQVFVRKEDLTGLISLMDSVFGQGASMPLNIRPCGAIQIDLENKGV